MDNQRTFLSILMCRKSNNLTYIISNYCNVIRNSPMLCRILSVLVKCYMKHDALRAEGLKLFEFEDQDILYLI